MQKNGVAMVLLFCRLVGWWPQEIDGHFIGHEQEIP